MTNSGSTHQHTSKIMKVFCPDCRGRFETELEDSVEENIIECSLCMAEIEILQLSPLKVQLFQED